MTRTGGNDATLIKPLESSFIVCEEGEETQNHTFRLWNEFKELDERTMMSI